MPVEKILGQLNAMEKNLRLFSRRTLFTLAWFVIYPAWLSAIKLILGSPAYAPLYGLTMMAMLVSVLLVESMMDGRPRELGYDDSVYIGFVFTLATLSMSRWLGSTYQVLVALTAAVVYASVIALCLADLAYWVRDLVPRVRTVNRPD